MANQSCESPFLSADPDPSVLLNVDPGQDPADFSMRIQIQEGNHRN